MNSEKREGKRVRQRYLRVIFVFFFFTFSFLSCFALSAQTASRTDGVNVFYYDSLLEAVAATTADTASIDRPDEITLLADIVLTSL